MSTVVPRHRVNHGVFASSAVALALFVGAASAEPWSFGIISDTQWKASPDGKNPNAVAVNVINHVNEQFIKHGVKFVVAVGDVTQDGDTVGMDTTATFRQALYNAGIGFYPVRGNHEDGSGEWQEFVRVFPQTGYVPDNAGWNNATPEDAFVDNTDYGQQTKTSDAPFKVGAHFTSELGFDGLTYSFDYDNARFVLIDQFKTESSPTHTVLTEDDVNWVCGRLADPARPEQAFVFAHKHLMSENHADTLFGGDPSVNPALQNQYMSCLDGNGVRYHIGGHDHMHNRALVTSPDGESQVQNLVTASDSYKFYIPQDPSNDEKYNIPEKGIDNGPRELELSQELFTIGYYIVTVDGPRVTVDYWASPNGCDGDCDQEDDVIPYQFSKRETFGYSLNGHEFLIPQGASYAGVQDSFGGTTAKILGGENQSTVTVYDGRPTTKAVDTGWTPKTDSALASDILTLWGMADLGSKQTDPFVLSMSYDKMPTHQGNGSFGIATKDENGQWINAVDKNLGDSNKSFVHGPWKERYPVGTYGVDASTKTAWAVIDYNGDFAVARDIEAVPGHRR